MKVSITDDCISCGLCPEICPEVFEMPEGEKARPKVEIVPDGLVDKAKEACESCPVDAIVLEE
jgi:ferredoxin